MNLEKAIESIEQNDALKEKLEKMWRDEASAQQIADTLAQFDLEIDATQAEGLLAAIQNRQAEALNKEELDSDLLENIVGGNDATRTGKCTEFVYTTDCEATVEKNSWCGSNDACLVFANQYKYKGLPRNVNKF